MHQISIVQRIVFQDLFPRLIQSGREKPVYMVILSPKHMIDNLVVFLRIGIIGCGAIGSVLFKAFEDKVVDAELVALYDVYPDKCRELVEKSSNVKPVICSEFECLIKSRPDLVVEAASQDAVREYVPRLVSNGVSVVVLSVGALIDEELRKTITEKCRETGARVYVPSGAIAGIDAITASSLEGIDRVILITHKNPRSISRESLEKLGFTHEIDRETVIFEGPAEEAVRRLPFNINVAATLKLASKAEVIVKFIADPSVDKNIHEIILESKATRLHVVVENTPHPRNPKTSFLAALSAIELLRRLTSEYIVIGT